MQLRLIRLSKLRNCVIIIIVTVIVTVLLVLDILPLILDSIYSISCLWYEVCWGRQCMSCMPSSLDTYISICRYMYNKMIFRSSLKWDTLVNPLYCTLYSTRYCYTCVGPQYCPLTLQVCKTIKSLPRSVSECFSDCSEYLVRGGWSPDGKWVWLQLVERSQRALKIIMIPWETFSVEGEVCGVGMWCVCGHEGEVCGVGGCVCEGEVCVCAWVVVVLARNCADYIFQNIFFPYSPLLRPHPPVSSR